MEHAFDVRQQWGHIKVRIKLLMSKVEQIIYEY